MKENDISSILNIVENIPICERKSEAATLPTPLERGFLMPDREYLDTNYLLKEEEVFEILDDSEYINRTIRESLIESPFYEESRIQNRKKGLLKDSNFHPF